MKPNRPSPLALCAPILLAGLGLAGCARDPDTTPYPSLAVRPVEKQGFAEPTAKPVVLRPDPALDARIAEITRQLDTVEGEFAKAHDQAKSRAAQARGQAVGSDAWLAAQTELATLDEIRARGSAILTEVDDLAIKRAATLEPDYPSLVALRERATVLTTRQSDQIKALSASLPAA
jgi:hypothetical protein